MAASDSTKAKSADPAQDSSETAAPSGADLPVPSQDLGQAVVAPATAPSVRMPEAPPVSARTSPVPTQPGPFTDEPADAEPSPVPPPVAENTSASAVALPGRASFPVQKAVSASPVAAAVGGPLGAYEALARTPRVDDLAALTNAYLLEVARARRVDHMATRVAALATELGLTREDAETPYGNVLKVLESGPEGEAERALACAIWARGVASRPDDYERLAGDVLWLATHSAFDATGLVDRAFGDDAGHMWNGIASRVRRIDNGQALGRGEALVGMAALAESDAPAARSLRSSLALELKDRVLVRIASGDRAAMPGGDVHLEGEIVGVPRGPVTTALLAMTGILFVTNAARLVARLALAYRRPAEISLSSSGIRLKSRTEMLGRVLREREHVIVRSGLVRVVREVKYPRAAFYAGLLALALGSYIGVRAFADGVRSASPSLLLTGLVIVVVGIALDFALGSMVPSARGRVRVAFVPRSGETLCVGEVDADRADEAIARTLKNS